jgi:hypothetical protein
MRLGMATACALALLAAPLRADPPDARMRAREAYDRGAAAHERGDHAAAARELSLADALVPNPVTLQAALEAALDADDALLGMELGARSERGPAGELLSALVQKARSRFAGRVGKVRVACPGGCGALLDGKPVDAGRALFVEPGRHAVLFTGDGRTEARTFVVAPGAEVVLSPAPFDPAVPVFGALGGATILSGLFTMGFGVDARNRHDAFVTAGCAGPHHGDCAALADAGRAAQLRANVAIGVTSALAAGAAVAGVIALRPRGRDRASLVLGGAQIAALRVAWP